MHPKISIITQDLVLLRAGARGEEEVDYYLKLLPEDECYIFQGIRLQFKELKFQIDTLILLPWFILILEVKNYSGTVTFNSDFNQITRTLNGREDGFEDPIVQAKRQRYLLSCWLKEMQLPQIPIEFLVTFVKTSTILKNPQHSPEVSSKICLAGNLIFKIEHLRQKYSTKEHSPKIVNRLAKMLLEYHIPETPTYHPYNIAKDDLKTGIQCPACKAFRMFRVSGTWKCPSCGHTSKAAHYQAINDYFLLFNPTISNRQLQDFLHLPNQKLATKLLVNMNLVPQGFRKDRVYSPQPFKY